MSHPALLVSVHDVMPATLHRVAALLDWLEARGVDHVTLLVVPGLAWQGPAIHQLRRWQARGHRLAAHGWVHRLERPRGLTGRLHSLVISRDCGEHLGLDGAGVEALIRRSRQWFLHHGLGSPELYVPPAWALGPLPRPRRARLPFSLLETLGGSTGCGDGALSPCPCWATRPTPRPGPWGCGPGTPPTRPGAGAGGCCGWPSTPGTWN